MQANISCLDTRYNLGISSILKILLYIELEKYNVTHKKESFSENDLDVIVALYLYGGISSRQEMLDFVKQCSDNNLTKNNSEQSIRNVFTKARKVGFLRRRTSGNWQVTVFPPINSDILFVKCFLSNAENK